MKKVILVLNFCFILLSAKAQITVNYSYQKGTFISGCDSIVPNSIFPGSKGANQTWDFTALRNIYEDTSIYMDASASPYFSKFPNANLAFYHNTVVGDTGKSYIYYNIDANKHLTFYGDVTYSSFLSQNLTAYASQPCIDTVTVLSYGKTNEDTVMLTSTFAFPAFPGVDSMKIINHEINIDTVDAWGTVKLPGNISYNSLREKSITYVRSDVYLRYLGSWAFNNSSYDTSIAYFWYTDILTQPIVEIFLDSAGKIVSSQYYLTTVTGLMSNKLQQENLRAFPNPAKANFSLDISGLDKSQINISLVSTTGEIFLPEWNSNNDIMQVNTAALKGGLYHWMLKNDEGKFYQGSILLLGL
jgi:hypothetical protein